MSQDPVPAIERQVQAGRQRHGVFRLRLQLFAVIAVVLSLGVSSLVAWPGPSRHAGAASNATLTVSPNSGLAGSVTFLNGAGFQYSRQTYFLPLLFDGAQIGSVTVSTCTNTLIGGFGSACNGTAVGFQVPAGAKPGPHTFEVKQTNSDHIVTADAIATFTVVAPATDTPTSTATPVATDTQTSTPPPASTATNTPPPASTATNTPPPASTATNTPPPASTATATATKVPKAKTKFVVLARPEFNHDQVAIALHTGAGEKIHIQFSITIAMADGSVRKVFGASHDGVTNTRGLLTYNLKIAYPERKAGRAALTISENGPADTHTVRRTYLYKVYG
ncbi:MAG: hypothetical protein JWO42_1518 [Chloroflexi bacterium]|nr:hypothetical protein [Chloroflexota bacterium]